MSIASQIQSFAWGIRQDYAAVEAALATSWSNGQTDGQVNRLKFIKRQMHGRARFDLLCLRVLGPLDPHKVRKNHFIGGVPVMMR